MRKLPNIFKPNINNRLENNKEVYYSFFENQKNQKDDNKKTISSALNTDSSNNKRYLILTAEKKYTSEIMSRVGNNIIIKNGKAISIDDIISIEEI